LTAIADYDPKTDAGCKLCVGEEQCKLCEETNKTTTDTSKSNGVLQNPLGKVDSISQLYGRIIYAFLGLSGAVALIMFIIGLGILILGIGLKFVSIGLNLTNFFSKIQEVDSTSLKKGDSEIPKVENMTKEEITKIIKEEVNNTKTKKSKKTK